ncbi:hypothetical protein [Herbaspirillum seropedicae]|uniref:hypothetical protein n=1 Tax=Herbaspirillum seropedicae TaxID=964 RepID=UPI00086385F4|nr:hypothetical protein [Herbaspirillum seropedicae]AON52494.1 hypothetical protein Hsc_0181 [Herbaspirillum seropedicae]
MSPLHRLRCLRTPALVAVLAMSLLLAQMLGFVHGIAHAGWAPGTVHSLISDALFDEGEGDDHAASAHVHGGQQQGEDPAHVHADHSHHSCVSYAAAALSAGAHFDFPPLPLMPPVRVLALWQAFASWDPPLNCHFSSRAPPC